MTEAEANEKWCPFVGDGTISPHVQSGLAEGRCIGSKCMAWRWHLDPVTSLPRGDGYCGLAGKP